MVWIDSLMACSSTSIRRRQKATHLRIGEKALYNPLWYRISVLHRMEGVSERRESIGGLIVDESSFPDSIIEMERIVTFGTSGNM